MSYITVGVVDPNLVAFDTQILSYLNTTEIPAASLSIRHGGVLKFSHAYYHFPSFHQPIPGASLFRIGSLTMPLVAAAVRNYVSHYKTPKFTLHTLVTPALRNSPYGTISPTHVFQDLRWDSIQVQHLIEQNAGFDSSFDNFFDARGVAQRAAGDGEPPNKARNVADIVARPLSYDPGIVTGFFQYFSCMSYVVLGMFIESVMAQPLVEFVRQWLSIGKHGYPNSALTGAVPCIHRANTGFWLGMEVPPNSAGVAGNSVFDTRITGTISQADAAVGGGGFFVEGQDSAVGLVATTDACVSFMDNYIHDGTYLPVTRSSYGFSWYDSFAVHFAYLFWWGDGLTCIAVCCNQVAWNQAAGIGNAITNAMNSITNWS